jgi:hypothetical protein
MQMRLAVPAFILCNALAVLAHPSVGVVIDSHGNVYYSDLAQVWRIEPDGTKSVVVPNVHTHELYLDAQDSLYGEHLWYEGERVDKWGHYVWKRAPEGAISMVIPRTEGFLDNYSFARDQAGTMYFAAEPAKPLRTELRWRTAAGKVSPMARGFRDIRWIHATPAGTVFLIDDGDIVRVKGGRVDRLATKLAPRGERHALMGLWSDGAENVYVADSANREVKRITPEGRVTTFARSRFPWTPTGGTFAKNGDLWLLEWSVMNGVRVRKVRK